MPVLVNVLSLPVGKSGKEVWTVLPKPYASQSWRQALPVFIETGLWKGPDLALFHLD